jgi:hypothetical protein
MMWFEDARSYLAAIVAIWLTNGRRPVSVYDLDYVRFGSTDEFDDAMRLLVGQKALTSSTMHRYEPTAYGIYAVLGDR